MKIFILQIVLSGLLFATTFFLFVVAIRKKKKNLFVYSTLSFILFIIVALWTFVFAVKKTYAKASSYASALSKEDTTKGSNSAYSLFVDYDEEKADTKSNRKRFEDYLGVRINDTVKNVYCFADFLGADYTIQLGFNCDTSMLRKIIQLNKLTRQTFTGGRNLDHEFPWWNETKIDNLVPFKMEIEFEQVKWLWYDSTSHNAYYLEYSL